MPRLKFPEARYGSKDHPLRIGDIEIPCYVLADGQRVLAQRGLQVGVGLSRSGGKLGARRLSTFLASLESKGIDTKDLIARTAHPIVFIPPHGGNPALGYEATILPDFCAVVLEAHQGGKLLPQQKHIAQQCRILLHAFAGVGIIALVDEATGYQDDRDRQELQRILAAYIAKELLPWTKRFPDEFYRELFRLQGWQYSPMSVKRPQYVGRLTNELVYEKLPPGVLPELRKKNPVVPETGRRKHKHHQLLTIEVGNPHLEKQLVAVTTLMKVSANWREFRRNFARAFPPPDGIQGNLFEEEEESGTRP